MTTFLHLLSTTCLLVCILSTPSDAAVSIGENAPAFMLYDSNGKQRSLSDCADHIVVLEWTNHQCPFVKKQYHHGTMQTIQKTYTAKGVVWLSIISSAPGKQGHVSPKQANRIVQKRQAAPTAVLLDPQGHVGRLYGATTTPHLFIIDKRGRIAYMGAMDTIPSANPDDVFKGKNLVAAALDDLLAGRPVTRSVSPPYGCSVKYAR